MLASVLVLYLAASTAARPLPPGKGKALVQRTCVQCHALKVVTSKRATKEQWSALVDQMVSRGADLNDDEIEVVVNYLSKNFPLGKSASGPGKSVEQMVNVNQASASELAAVLHLSPDQGHAIVAYRDKNGKFKDWHDLAGIPGIQSGDIEARKDKLQF
jgi:competence ComEA-like helix-hairpin-helix protein